METISKTIKSFEKDIKANLKDLKHLDLKYKDIVIYINKIISELKPYRINPNSTRGIIASYFGEISYLKQNKICPQQNAKFIEYWLLIILKSDDSYQYASNYLQQRSNRITGIGIPLKDKSDMELIKLIYNK